VTTAAFALTAAEIARAVTGRLVSGDPEALLPTVSTDTRTIRPGDLFVALRGPRFDGHAYVGEALSRGAAGFVVADAAEVAGEPAAAVVIVVDDTLAALQALARHVRRRSGARVVAITGSAGKTTTKEAIATVLSARYRTLRNRGNLNNHIGLPLSLIELQDGAEVAVMELGMNHAGEIRRLVEIAEPEIRVWTNVGTAHLQYFGSRDAIAAAKAEILEGAGPGTVLIANADDDLVMRHAAGFAGRLVTFGLGRDADVTAVAVEDLGLDGARATVRTPSDEATLTSHLPGRAHLHNLLAAVAAGLVLDVPLDEIAARLDLVRAAPRRGEVRRLGRDVVVFDDCYNSSPSALVGSLHTLSADRSGRRRVAFLGEMLELGDQSPALHRECGRATAAAGVRALVTVGAAPARALGEAAVTGGLDAGDVRHVGDSEQAAALVPDVVRGGDLVLVKGSRGTRMERVVERLEEEFA
jgi:UDP-N-acetylmuramoyl-tripeptide--D-alanyl-D-alanine ligase